MRAWPGTSVAWLVGCVLLVLGCSAPTTEDAPPTLERINERPEAVQAVHHARQEVRPVLTWRDNPGAAAPLSLTASDGSGLDLVTMKARVVIEDPLAFTELHLTFDNPEARRREGRFEIDLPPGAALSRLAMKIGGALQEGEVVERGKARRTFEDFMHERPQVDPALLERDAGNRVRARVFPILPHERKEIIVSFSQELGAAPYRLPLEGLSTLEQFDARVVVKTHDPAQDRSSLASVQSAQRVVELRRRDFTPDKDLVVELEGSAAGAGLHAGDLAVVRVRPDAARPAARPESLLVLVDTSASSTAGFEARVERLGSVLRALAEAGDFRVRVVGFDQRRLPVFEGMASALGVDALADLIEGRPLGASDLGAALADAARSDARWERVLLVSDGVATAGVTDRGALRAAVRTLEAVGARRLDALAPAGRHDRERLADLTSALPEPGIIIDDRAAETRIARALTQAPFGDVELTVDGASWVWPRSLAGIEPGQDVLVFAHYDGPRPPAVRVEFSDPSLATQIVETLEVERPMVERAWARARIDRIEHRRARLPAGSDPSRDALDARIIELSTHYRVLTDLTALLVLETEADYRRFRIDRRGKADILTVDGGSVRVLRRSEAPPAPLPVEDDLAALRATSADDEDLLPQLARRFDPDATGRAAGLLGMVASQSGHFLASPYGAAFAAGNDDEDVWGGMSGAEVGEAFGVGGLGLVGAGGGGGAGAGYGASVPEAPPPPKGSRHGGLVGTGRGGGGVGEGTIGLGNIGLIGKGAGAGSGAGSGAGFGRGSGAGFGGRGKRVPQVRMAKAKIQGSLDRSILRRIVRAHLNEVRHCYHQGLIRDPSLAGRVAVEFIINASGRVAVAGVKESSLTDPAAGQCIARAVKRWRFPAPPGGGTVEVVYPFVVGPGFASTPSTQWLENRRDTSRARRGTRPRHRRLARAAHTGRFAEAQRLLATGEIDAAYDLAWDWVRAQPSDVLGLLALGEVLERRERPALAARVYGSLIDLYPSRADIRRAAGQRLERLGDEGLALAVDTYDKAVRSRPDHPSGARLHAWALVEQGEHERAFEALDAAVRRRYPAGRFAGVSTLLRQDRALVAAAWLAGARGDARVRAQARVREAGVHPSTEASTRFVVTWETDTTDVDVLLRTPGSPRNHGRRIADVRTGYGPEARVLRGETMPDRLRVAVRYFDRSSQGHALGTVHVVTHDGEGRLRVQARPFVLMQQRGVLDLGVIETGLGPVESAT